jgi:hypothetical protein
MLLAKVAMFLGTSFLQDSGCSFSTRLLCTLFLAVRSFIVTRSVRVLESFLATYTLDNFERQKEWMHVYRSSTFLVKVELILPRVREHSWLARSASSKGTFIGIMVLFTLGL